jgi:hypothetical protein
MADISSERVVARTRELLEYDAKIVQQHHDGLLTTNILRKAVAESFGVEVSAIKRIVKETFKAYLKELEEDVATDTEFAPGSAEDIASSRLGLFPDTRENEINKRSTLGSIKRSRSEHEEFRNKMDQMTKDLEADRKLTDEMRKKNEAEGQLHWRVTVEAPQQEIARAEEERIVNDNAQMMAAVQAVRNGTADNFQKFLYQQYQALSPAKRQKVTHGNGRSYTGAGGTTSHPSLVPIQQTSTMTFMERKSHSGRWGAATVERAQFNPK